MNFFKALQNHFFPISNWSFSCKPGYTKLQNGVFYSCTRYDLNPLIYILSRAFFPSWVIFPFIFLQFESYHSSFSERSMNFSKQLIRFFLFRKSILEIIEIFSRLPSWEVSADFSVSAGWSSSIDFEFSVFTAWWRSLLTILS